jgi:hypothetical protein
MNNFFVNLLEGMVLVGIVILLSLSLRASMIVMLAIPISILIGIGFVDMSGYGLEQMSIAGLVIVLGILVDNAIVVTDSTFEQRKIKIGFNLNLPNGEFRGTNHSLRILNNKFEPLGEKIKNGFLLKENLRRNFSTTKSGTIDAEIIFHSSKYDNNGIVSFTLEVIEE